MKLLIQFDANYVRYCAGGYSVIQLFTQSLLCARLCF